MATHASILARRISWTEEPGGIQSIGSQRVDWATEHAHTHNTAHIRPTVGSRPFSARGSKSFQEQPCQSLASSCPAAYWKEMGDWRENHPCLQIQTCTPVLCSPPGFVARDFSVLQETSAALGLPMAAPTTMPSIGAYSLISTIGWGFSRLQSRGWQKCLMREKMRALWESTMGTVELFLTLRSCSWPLPSDSLWDVDPGLFLLFQSIPVSPRVCSAAKSGSIFCRYPLCSMGWGEEQIILVGK